jgi:uncharacterized protein (TIGR02271 family)
MQNSARSIAAFFRNESDAENAIRELKDSGFRADQIGTSLTDYDIDNSQHQRGERGFWDKVGDFFSGDTGYEDRDTGAADGRRQEGPAVGRTLTIPDDYSDRIDSGGVFVTVLSDKIAQAEQILVRNHGEVERDFSNWQSEEYDNAEQPSRGASAESDFADEGRRIQLLSEVLRVRKDRVQRGEVRLRKEVVTENQNIQVPVTREELVIERMPVEGREATGQNIGAQSEIRVPLSEERVSTEKVPVVREEVRVGKRAVSETRNVTDETRREELRVDKEGDVNEIDHADVKAPRRKKTA